MPNEPPDVEALRKKLFDAAQTGDPAVFLTLEVEDRRALIHPPSSDTVLHVAARNGKLDVMKHLIEAMNLRHLLTAANRDGSCALHIAAQNLHLKAAEYLIKQGTAVDVLKRADWTPLMLACTRVQSSEMINLLLRSGAQATLRNKDGWTAFHIATRTGCLKNLETLLAHDPSLWETRSKNGRTPFHTAAIHGHSEVLEKLLEASTSLADSEDSCGTTPLMDAARYGSKECCSILLNSGVCLEKADKIGRNVFHVAAQSGSPLGVLELLRDRGIDVNSLTANGQTALHLAARENQVDTAKHLLGFGTDPTIRDNSGATARDIAEKFKNGDLADILPV